MKYMTKFALLMIALITLIASAGCGKSDFDGSWVGYDDDKTMYRLSIQENGQGHGNIYVIKKDDTLLFNGIRFKKESSPDITNDILKKLQFVMNQELKIQYHQYGEHGLDKSSDHVTLGKITFDDSVLTDNK